MEKPKTVKIVNEYDQVVDSADVGLPGLFHPQDCDIADEFANNEALREYQRDSMDNEGF